MDSNMRLLTRALIILTVIKCALLKPHVLILDSLGDAANRTSNAQIYTPIDNALGNLEIHLEFEYPPIGAVVNNIAYFISGRQLYIHNPATNVTQLGASLLRKRQFATATALKQFIFVCGGYFKRWDIYLRTCEKYDTTINTWSHEVKRMQRGRGHHAAVSVKERLYIFGGQRGLSDSLAIYDSRLNTWFRGARMPYKAANHAAVALGAHIFTCGGTGTSKCSGYNIRTNRWYIMAPLVKPRAFHEMILWNGSPLIIGGLWDKDKPISFVEYYDWIHNRTLLLHMKLAEPTADFAAVLLF